MDFDFDSDNEDMQNQGGQQGAQNFFNQFADEAVNPDFVQKMDSVLFVIDCQQHLFDQLSEQQENQMQVVLNCMTSFLKTKIISNVYDQVGLILYNVKNDSNPLKFQGINRVYPLDSPSAERIKEVPNLQNDFEIKYGFSKDTPLHEVLWLCNSEFKNLDKSKFNMRVFLFTPDDNPHADNQQLRDQTIHHMKQLAQMEVDIEVFPLEKATKTKFDMRKFYIDVLPLNLDEINDTVLDTSDKIMEIQTRLRQREFKKRTLNRVLFDLGNEAKCGVKLYCHLNKAKKPIARKLHSESNKPLKRTIKQLCTETGQVLYNEHIGTYFPLAKEKIKISKEEVAQIKAFDSSGMKLMGFKPRSKLKLYHNYRPSYFLYPDEQRVKGSSQLFHALITQMIAKDKIAIVRFTPRKGAQVRFCALLPQEESYNENHFQTPPGFNLIYLPYADDIRTLKAKLPTDHTKVSKDLLNIGKLLVTCLNLVDFDPRSFEDPSLQKFYSHLQAHALNEENPEDPVDLIQPDEEGFDRHQELIDLFQNQLELESSKGGSSPVKKTTKTTTARGGATKKVNKGAQGTKAVKAKPVKRGKKGKMEEEEEYQSDDSRDGNNEYDMNDGFVVPDEDDESGDYVPKKKKQNQKKGGRQKKQVKSEDEIEEEDNGLSVAEEEQIRANEIEVKIMEGEFDRLKMDDLKFYLKKNKLNDKGRKKQDLVDRALNYISEKNQ